jgi:hypothetical protein
MPASGPAEAIAPAKPTASYGIRCHKRRPTVSWLAVRGGGQKAAEPVKILVVLPEQDAGEPLGRIRAWKWLYSLTTATPGSPRFDASHAARS